MLRLIKKRLPYIALLAVCFIAYLSFHAVRGQIPFTALKNSFPSLLTPLAMFGLIEFLPAVRFHSRRNKFVILAGTTAFAALWLEGIVPRFTDRATGDFGDAAAMCVGFLLFWIYDSVIANTWHSAASPCRTEQSDSCTQDTSEDVFQASL